MTRIQKRVIRVSDKLPSNFSESFKKTFLSIPKESAKLKSSTLDEIAKKRKMSKGQINNQILLFESIGVVRRLV